MKLPLFSIIVFLKVDFESVQAIGDVNMCYVMLCQIIQFVSTVCGGEML